jgi:AraC family transcriptional activator of pyochelin receptor
MSRSEGAAVEARAFIEVSPEMTTILGSGAGKAPIPTDPVALLVTTAPRRWALGVEPRPDVVSLVAVPERIVFLVSRDAVERIGGGDLLDSGATSFHLSAELRAIALALLEPPVAAEARATYQLAKSIEFLCEAIRQFQTGHLAPLTGDAGLSVADTRRMLAARRLIEDRAGEKLTLDFIARSCGLNRSKLTRGYKALFACTVAQAIAERRLELASRMLLTTDLPVSSIGYESGYLNNASFARAFGRRFGSSPSDFRGRELAA